MQKCPFGILEKQEKTPLQIRVFAIFLLACVQTITKLGLVPEFNFVCAQAIFLPAFEVQ